MSGGGGVLQSATGSEQLVEKSKQGVRDLLESLCKADISLAVGQTMRASGQLAASLVSAEQLGREIDALQKMAVRLETQNSNLQLDREALEQECKKPTVVAITLSEREEKASLKRELASTTTSLKKLGETEVMLRANHKELLASRDQTHVDEIERIGNAGVSLGKSLRRQIKKLTAELGALQSDAERQLTAKETEIELADAELSAAKTALAALRSKRALELTNIKRSLAASKAGAEEISKEARKCEEAVSELNGSADALRKHRETAGGWVKALKTVKGLENITAETEAGKLAEVLASWNKSIQNNARLVR